LTALPFKGLIQRSSGDGDWSTYSAV